MTPRLEIFFDRLLENANAIVSLCHSRKVETALVTKACCAHPAVFEAFLKAGADLLADSRCENLAALKKSGCSKPLMMLRLPSPEIAKDVVQLADYSLNSELETLKALSDAALSLKTRHKTIIMIETGDLREGIFPEDAVELIKKASDFSGIEIAGLGCNMTCYGGVIPTSENMNSLVRTRDLCRKETGLDLEIISGANSSGLPLLRSGGLPKEINQFRIGETILLGRNVIDRTPFPETRQDAFRVVASIVEIGRKPSIPKGVRGQDAFGRKPEFTDKGIRRRALCNLGRQDGIVEDMSPEDPGIQIVGASSDYLILDIEEALGNLSIGSEIAFFPSYGALLTIFTSPFVKKCVIRGT